MDDFAWLSLHTRVHDFQSLLSTLFRPMAQGTVRPLSERLVFLGFWELFGADARPYRALVFLTQFANLALLCLITRRVTRSAMAGLLAPLLWLVSPNLYTAMTWTSAYNQILCAFLLLSAFWMLLRFIDTDRWRYYACMWAAFLLGFGALELNVVFPAIAFLYTFLFHRKHVKYVLPMFVVSIAYAAWHRSVGQSLSTSAYAMDLRPGSLLKIWAKYVWFSFSGAPAADLLGMDVTFLKSCAWAVEAAVAVFIVAMLWKRQWLVVFFAGWFAITVAPYLPLSNHFSPYYLAVPAIGFAMLGAWGLELARRSGPKWMIVAVLGVLLFAVPCASQARVLTRWSAEKSYRVKNLLQGMASAYRQHPDKCIVLSGVDDDLFWYGLYDYPERIFGWRRPYMTEETRGIISPVRPEDISERFMATSVLVRAIRDGKAVVYDVTGPRLRNITRVYADVRSLSPASALLPSMVDTGNPLFEYLLKSGWRPAENSYRWTTERAELQIRGPEAPGSQLRVSGRVMAEQTAQQPMRVTVSVDGKVLGTQTIPRGALEFAFLFPIPDEFAGKDAMNVVLEPDRTLKLPGEPQGYGLIMGAVSVVKASPALP